MNFFSKHYCLTIPASVFIIYLITLAPTVIQIDSGELAAVQATLGIAHPTGYPLFTISGNLFSRIPVPIDIIDKLNLLAALWCAGGLVLFMYTGRLLFNNPDIFFTEEKHPHKKSSKKHKNNEDSKPVNNEISEEKKKIALAAGALMLGFSRTFWMQSTSVEVYSLHIFLLSLIIYCLVKAYIKKGNDLWAWLIFAASLALGFSNHMTTLLILPGAAYLYFYKNGFNKNSFKKIALMLLVFFPLLAGFYTYLVVRASQDTLLNWGNPDNFVRLFRHISGKQYQVWLFSSAGAAKKQLAYFFQSLPSEYVISLFICLIGMIYSFYTARKVFIFLLICFVSAVLYSINYDIADIDSYFLLAYISLAYFAVYGTVKVLTLVKFNKHAYAISSCLVGLFVLLQVYANYNRVNQNRTYIFEDYTKAILSTSNKDSFVLSYLWDYFISPSYYFQHVENFRKDVAVIDKELMRRSWYYNQLEHMYPGIMKNIQNEKNNFLEAVKPFENDDPFDDAFIEARYRSLLTALLKTNAENRQVYISPELFENEMQSGQLRLPEGYTLVPDLLLFKMVKGNGYVPAKDPDFTIRVPERQNHYTQVIEDMAGSMLMRRALYELQFDKVDRAKLYIKKVKQELPDYRIPPGIANVLDR